MKLLQKPFSCIISLVGREEQTRYQTTLVTKCHGCNFCRTSSLITSNIDEPDTANETVSHSMLVSSKSLPRNKELQEHNVTCQATIDQTGMQYSYVITKMLNIW